MRKTKLSLIATIAVGLLAISTAGVSTYAWFRSAANATVTAQSTSTTITASKPDEYTFYAFKGNRIYDYNNDGDPDDFTANGTFSHDFHAITSSNASALTDYSTIGFYPTKSLIYCLGISGHVSGVDVTLNISSMISNNAIKQTSGAQHRYVTGGTTEINIGWAIDIYTMASQDGSGYFSSWYNVAQSDSNDKFRTSNQTGSTLVSQAVLNQGSYASQTIDVSASPINLFTANSTQKTWSTIYIFYRILFSNAGNTLYTEQNATDGNDIPKTAGNREFTANSSTGTSNCYAGLKFQLINLDLSWSN